jgi:3-oxoacyl-(acyl-carrier-protein) synthase
MSPASRPQSGAGPPPPAAVLSSSLILPGGLASSDLLRGTSGVARLGAEHNPSIGAPVTVPIEPPAGFPHPIAPRALLLAVEAADRLERELGPRYGLVLALSCLHAEPAYLEHILRHRDEPAAIGDVFAFHGDFPLEYLAARLGVSGPRVRLDSACASGSDALAVAHEWLELGVVEDVVVVAAASMVDPVGLMLFRNLHALSDEDDLGASRPFDRRRRGFVMGEGAAAAWLSSRRPIAPRGFLCGHGRSMNAEKFTAMPRDLDAMAAACLDALGPVRDLVYISAHGTGTPIGDPCETRLYKQVLGDAAYRIPASSMKSMTGHCLGASSMIEALVTLDALEARTAPPTLNLEQPDPECDLDYVPLTPRAIGDGFALSVAFAFGGHNSALLLAREAPW